VICNRTGCSGNEGFPVSAIEFIFFIIKFAITVSVIMLPFLYSVHISYMCSNKNKNLHLIQI
jgi:hypothetical protein